jgi:hypothetical protein
VAETREDTPAQVWAPAERATTQKLTIHIGANKTGSSAIQQFLKRNRDWLRKREIVVPDKDLRDRRHVAGHHVWYFAPSQADATKRPAELSASIDGLFANGDVRQVVISAENLSDSHSQAWRWFTDVASRHETEVVLYVRRQDDLILSSWQQWYAKVRPDFWAWLTSIVGVMGDWRLILEQWESIVGREQIRVRLYERDRLAPGDVVADFAQFLEVDEAIPDERPEGLVNPSFNEAIVALIPGSGLFKDAHDPGFYKFLDEMLGAASHKRPNESAISYEQRVAILRRYEESNAWVRQRYFADTDTPPTLFKMPLRHEYRVPTEQELVREQMQMLMRLVFELSRR